MPEPGALLHAHALTLIARAESCLSWRGARAHAGVHQGRKSMRRLRACLALAFGGNNVASRAIDQAIAGTCRSLSALRDAQARTHAVDRLLSSSTDRVAISDLRRLRRLEVAQRVSAMKQAQHADPEFGKRRYELLQLRRELDGLPWNRVDDYSMQRSIARTLRRCEQAQRRALDDGNARDWHRWRRRVRRLGQQHGVLVACGIVPADFLPPQRKLAHLLGESQDCAVLIEQFSNDMDLPKQFRQRLVDSVRTARDAINGEIRSHLVASPASLTESYLHHQASVAAAVELLSQIQTTDVSSSPPIPEEPVP
jgi:hypothetical protein